MPNFTILLGIASGAMLVALAATAIPTEPPPRFGATEAVTPTDLAFRESPYCRPFIHCANPQVVWLAFEFTTAAPENRVQECSGVVVGPRSILTAKHCVKLTGGTLVKSTVKTITGRTFEGKVRRVDPDHDIALVRVDQPLLIKPAKIALKASMALTLVGYGCRENPAIPLPLQRQAIALHQSNHELLFTGCVCPGDSGGPIFDDDGSLVALMCWTSHDGKTGRGTMIQDFMEL